MCEFGTDLPVAAADTIVGASAYGRSEGGAARGATGYSLQQDALDIFA
jgi:hypothetical protein